MYKAYHSYYITDQEFKENSWSDKTIFFDSSISLDELSLTSANLNLEVNKSGTFSFEVPPSNIEYENFRILNDYIYLYRDDECIYPGRVYAINKNFNNVLSIDCEGLLSLFADTIMRPFTKESNLTDLITYILESHNNQVDGKKKINLGIINIEDIAEDGGKVENRSYSDYQSTINILNDLLEEYDGYMSVRYADDQLYFDWTKDQAYNAQEINFGENLLDVNQTSEADGLYTVVIPFGDEVETTDTYIIDNNGEKTYSDDDMASISLAAYKNYISWKLLSYDETNGLHTSEYTFPYNANQGLINTDLVASGVFVDKLTTDKINELRSKAYKDRYILSKFHRGIRSFLIDNICSIKASGTFASWYIPDTDTYPEYKKSLSYTTGSKAKHDNKYYICTGNTTGEWDSTKWNPVAGRYTGSWALSVSKIEESTEGETTTYSQRWVRLTVTGTMKSTGVSDTDNWGICLWSENKLSGDFMDGAEFRYNGSSAHPANTNCTLYTYIDEQWVEGNYHDLEFEKAYGYIYGGIRFGNRTLFDSGITDAKSENQAFLTAYNLSPSAESASDLPTKDTNGSLSSWTPTLGITYSGSWAVESSDSIQQEQIAGVYYKKVAITFTFTMSCDANDVGQQWGAYVWISGAATEDGQTPHCYPGEESVGGNHTAGTIYTWTYTHDYIIGSSTVGYEQIPEYGYVEGALRLANVTQFNNGDYTAKSENNGGFVIFFGDEEEQETYTSSHRNSYAFPEYGSTQWNTQRSSLDSFVSSAFSYSFENGDADRNKDIYDLSKSYHTNLLTFDLSHYKLLIDDYFNTRCDIRYPGYEYTFLDESDYTSTTSFYSDLREFLDNAQIYNVYDMSIDTLNALYSYAKSSWSKIVDAWYTEACGQLKNYILYKIKYDSTFTYPEPDEGQTDISQDFVDYVLWDMNYISSHSDYEDPPIAHAMFLEKTGTAPNKTSKPVKEWTKVRSLYLLGKEYYTAKKEEEGTATGTAINKHKLTLTDGGKSAVDYLENEEAIAKHGRIVCYKEFEGVTDVDILKEKAKEYLDSVSKPKYTIDLNAADLHGVDKEIANFKLGRITKILSIPNGIYTKNGNLINPKEFVTKKLSLNLLDPSQDELELGEESTGYIDNESTSYQKTKKTIANISNNYASSGRVNQDIQDVNNTISTEVKTLSSSIKQLETYIESTVTERIDNAEKGISEVQSVVKQTSDSFGIQFDSSSWTGDTKQISRNIFSFETRVVGTESKGYFIIAHEGGKIHSEQSADSYEFVDASHNVPLHIDQNGMLSTLVGVNAQVQYMKGDSSVWATRLSGTNLNDIWIGAE